MEMGRQGFDGLGRCARRSVLVVRLAAPALCATLACLSASCAADRRLMVLSEPPGALVRLDNQLVGTTPYEAPFDSYGTRRLTLYKDGYLPHSRLLVLEPPWYARFPLDLFSEVLIPVGWRDWREERIALEPVREGEISAPDLEAVLRRAESLRLAEPEGPRPALPAGETPPPPGGGP
jgi:hypothetical protein